MSRSFTTTNHELGNTVNYGNVSRETFFQSAAICVDLRPIQLKLELKCFDLCV